VSADIALIQPRHPYAPPIGSGAKGHIYFPTSLYTFAARIRASGGTVQVYDENISGWAGDEALAGFACIGSPYIPGLASRSSGAERLKGGRVLLGGQGIRGLSPSEFVRLFGTDAINGNLEEELHAHAILSSSSPAQESVSIAEQIGELDDETFRLYFSRETPLYLSQGCRFSCTFCGALRTVPGEVVVRESYRALTCLDEELRMIVARSSALGIAESAFYVSNLDLFQTPASLSKIVEIVRSVRREFPLHHLRFRGLSTANSFLLVHRRDPQLIQDLVEIGFSQIGFGIDGATPDVWRAIRKPHKSDDCLRAVLVAREVYGIVPEALMVFGHDGHDTPESLRLAVDTVKRLGDEFGAIPRPHVAKSLVPGNDGWRISPALPQKAYLLENPWAFQFLDFTCLPTDLTHVDPDFRASVREAFLSVCGLPSCLTQYVRPEDRRDSVLFDEAVIFNQGRFDI
jgi:hypothetical protein